jgi:hypothetical protein
MPSPEAIFKCMRVATTPESANYLYQRAEQEFKKQKILDKTEPLLEALAKFAQYVQFKHDYTGNIWGGDKRGTEMTDFQKWQAELARITSADLSNVSALLDYAVSDASQLIRGYSDNGTPLDKQTSEAMDVVFNAWLATKNYISKDGIVFQSTESGEIQKDKAGNPIKANPAELRAAIKDLQDGFKSYAEDKNSTLDVTVKEHPYTAPKKAQEKEMEHVSDKQAKL